MAFGFGHWWILIVVLFVLAAAIVAIIVASNVLTHWLVDRKEE